MIYLLVVRPDTGHGILTIFLVVSTFLTIATFCAVFSKVNELFSVYRNLSDRVELLGQLHNVQAGQLSGRGARTIVFAVDTSLVGGRFLLPLVQGNTSITDIYWRYMYPVDDAAVWLKTSIGGEGRQFDIPDVMPGDLVIVWLSLEQPYESVRSPGILNLPVTGWDEETKIAWAIRRYG